MPSQTVRPTRTAEDLTTSSRTTTTPVIDRRRIVLFPARLFLAMGWLRAGAEKLIDGSWWTGTYLEEFLVDQQDAMLPFVRPITDLIGFRLGVMISAAVLVLEIGLGVCFATGKYLRTALRTACVLNIAFVALGVVSPSAFYLVIQLTLLLEISTRRPVRRGRTVALVGANIAGALVLAPFIGTLHPHAVIDDPAVMLATLAALYAATAVASLVTLAKPSSTS